MKYKKNTHTATEGAGSIKNAGPKSLHAKRGEVVVLKQAGAPLKIGRLQKTSNNRTNFKPSNKGYGNTLLTKSTARKAVAVTRGVVNAAKAVSSLSTSEPKTKAGSNFKPATFGKAFSHSRKTKGPKATFKWGGKEYSTVTKDDLKKAGGMSLREYSNKNKLKKSKLKFVK